MTTRLEAFALGMALFVLFGVVGRWDFEAQQADEARYCDMVKAGHWPDYAGTYRRVCRPPKTSQR
jgi:hypothetical protein